MSSQSQSSASNRLDSSIDTEADPPSVTIYPRAKYSDVIWTTKLYGQFEPWVDIPQNDLEQIATARGYFSCACPSNMPGALKILRSTTQATGLSFFVIPIPHVGGYNADESGNSRRTTTSGQRFAYQCIKKISHEHSVYYTLHGALDGRTSLIAPTHVSVSDPTFTDLPENGRFVVGAIMQLQSPKGNNHYQAVPWPPPDDVLRKHGLEVASASPEDIGRFIDDAASLSLPLRDPSYCFSQAFFHDLVRASWCRRPGCTSDERKRELTGKADKLLANALERASEAEKNGESELQRPVAQVSWKQSVDSLRQELEALGRIPRRAKDIQPEMSLSRLMDDSS